MKIKIIAKRVGQDPAVEEIDDSLEAMQSFVGGWIEAVALGDSNVSLYCDEEGKLKAYPPNIEYYDDVICGDCFVSRIDDEGEAVSVTEEDVTKYLPLLRAGRVP